MKNVQILALSGWSFGPKSLDPVLHRFSSRSTIDLSIEDWTHWLGAGDKKRPERAPSKNEIYLFGWSLGAFLLFPLLKHPSVKGGLFVSLAETFVKSEANPRGADPEVLRSMIRGLGADPEETLSGFRRECFSPEPMPAVDESAGSSVRDLGDLRDLIGGLEALENFDLRTVEVPPEKKVVLIHGKRDRVLPVFGARSMSKNRSLVYVEVENGGHALPLTHSDLVAAEMARLLENAAPHSP